MTEPGSEESVMDELYQRIEVTAHVIDLLADSLNIDISDHSHFTLAYDHIQELYPHLPLGSDSLGYGYLDFCGQTDRMAYASGLYTWDSEPIYPTAEAYCEHLTTLAITGVEPSTDRQLQLELF